MLPLELKQHNHWINWSLENRNGKLTKIPINPRTGGNAQSNNPETWTGYDEAFTANTKNGYSGVGFMFSKEIGIVGIDIDKCRNVETGEMSEQAKEILSTLDSYSEVSPSGSGVHIICKGKLPPVGRRKGSVEMYSEGRFFTITGSVLSDYSRNVEERTAELEYIHSKYIAKPRNNQEKRQLQGISDLDSNEIINKAMNSATGGKFNSLYNGNWKGLYPSQSEADLALANMLAFWCGRDPGKMDSIFRSSGLYRQKWDGRRGNGTYGQMVIDEAIRECREVYEVKKNYSVQSGSETLDEVKQFKPSDLGNAERLVAKHGSDLRYCHAWNKWLNWKGSHWEIDNTGEIERKAKNTIRGMYLDAANLQNEDQRTALAKHAARSESSRAIAAMIELTKSEPGIPITTEQLDNDIWLLNCKNGTLDLKTGELRAHKRNDLITKCIPVNFDSSPIKPVVWIDFLNTIMNSNQELISFLQRAIGYSLTGSTKEQCLFILYGSGANGKSTFMETISDLLNDYSKHSPPDTFLQKDSNGGPNNDVARLVGARLVVASEIEEGKRLNESLIKNITGGELLTARFMRAEYFEFMPRFKVFISTNHKPQVKGTDKAVWRRIRLIPFNVSIPPEEQDKDLLEKLRVELPAILNWAAQGCREYLKTGLGEPEEVKAATNMYKAEMDIMANFLSECCEVSTQLETRSQKLYEVYENWCRANGERPLTQTKFSLRLIEKGFKKEKTAIGAMWMIELIEQEEDHNPFTCGNVVNMKR